MQETIVGNEMKVFRQRLRRYKVVGMATEVGIAPATVYRIISGELKNPSYKTVRTLQLWMDAQ